MNTCDRGHPRDDAHTRLRPDGGRECRDCRRLRGRAHRRGITADELAAIEATGGELPPVLPLTATLPECWCCGRENQIKGNRGLCLRCYGRWQARGFTGPGPGPERLTQAERARDYLRVITANSAKEASGQIGVSPRTVTRWRKRLREAS